MKRCFNQFLIFLLFILNGNILFGQKEWEQAVSTEIIKDCESQLEITYNKDFQESAIQTGTSRTIYVGLGSKIDLGCKSIKGCLSPKTVTILQVLDPDRILMNFSNIYVKDNNTFEYQFNKLGDYIFKLHITSDVNSKQIFKKNQTHNTDLGLKVTVVKGYTHSQPINNLCYGTPYRLTPNSIDNGNDPKFSYQWFSINGSIQEPISNFDYTLTKDINYVLKVFGKEKKVNYNDINVTYKIANAPTTPDRDPLTDLTNCGIVKLYCKNKTLKDILDVNWRPYYNKKVSAGIVQWTTPNANAKIYYGNSCEATKSAPYEDEHSVTSPGTNILYIAAQDDNTKCWSDCRQITVELNDSKPEPPITSDVSACLCEHDELMLTATNLNPSNTLKTRWYKPGNETHITGSTLTVPREDNVYFVSTYNTKNLCESEKIPVNVYGIPCNTCLGQFAPIIGKKYVLSAWVKESIATETYQKAMISITFDGNTTKLGPFKAKGPMIEGWQKIEEEFTIPNGAVNLYLSLENVNTTTTDSPPVYFDDIRIHPFESNMVSYVYDPITSRLTAMLDENNYATYYTYDQEGNLIAVNKETIDGIKTIQENKTVLKRGLNNSNSLINSDIFGN